MRKISLTVGLLATLVGFGAVSTASTAFAAGCLPSNLPTISLSQDSMIPNTSFGYDTDAYEAALANGNACSSVQQSQRSHADNYDSHPNVSKSTMDTNN